MRIASARWSAHDGSAATSRVGGLPRCSTSSRFACRHAQRAVASDSAATAACRESSARSSTASPPWWTSRHTARDAATRTAGSGFFSSTVACRSASPWPCLLDAARRTRHAPARTRASGSRSNCRIRRVVPASPGWVAERSSSAAAAAAVASPVASTAGRCSNSCGRGSIHQPRFGVSGGGLGLRKAPSRATRRCRA